MVCWGAEPDRTGACFWCCARRRVARCALHCACRRVRGGGWRRGRRSTRWPLLYRLDVLLPPAPFPDLEDDSEGEELGDSDDEVDEAYLK